MKIVKTLIVAFAAIIFTASCSNKITENTQPVAVQFTGSIVETKAYDTTWETDDAIGITGGGYSNVKHTTNGNGNFAVAEGYDQIYIKEAGTTSFTAYYPWQELENDITTITANTKLQGSQKDFDFLYAEGEGSKSQKNVNFDFVHKMSKINITLKKRDQYSFDDMKNAQISFSGIMTNGEFNVQTGVAQGSSSTDDEEEWCFSHNVDDDSATPTQNVSIDEENETVTYSIIMFPQDLETTDVILSVKTSDDCVNSANLDFTAANRNIDNDSAKDELVAGRQYNITIINGGTAISVDNESIQAWEEVDGGEFIASK